MSNYSRAPRNRVGRVLHDVARRDVPDDLDLRAAVMHELMQRRAEQAVSRQFGGSRSAGYWVREGLKLAAAALVFVVIGAVLALTLRGDGSTQVGGQPEPTPAVKLTPDPGTPAGEPTSGASERTPVTLRTPVTSAIVALDPASGVERWRVEANGGGSTDGSQQLAPLLSPVIGGDTVYGCNETLYAFDAGDGTQRWRFDGARGAGFLPAADEARVYVPIEGALVALDAGTGQQIWSVPDLTHPAAGNGLVYALDADGGLHALDSATGAERWSFDIIVTSTVTIAGGRVYVAAWGVQGETDRVYALDATTGAEIWSAERKGVGTPYFAGVADGNAYVFSSGFPSTVVAYDAATGAERWGVDVQSLLPYPMAFAVGGGHLFYVEDTAETDAPATLVALDAATGERRWEVTAGEGLIIYTDGLVVLQEQPQGYEASVHVVAYDAATGAERWRLATTSTPTLAAGDGVLYLGFGQQ